MRRKPYTAIGIRRVPCCRCGTKPSIAEWGICADNGQRRGLCLECDIGLNRLAMRYAFGAAGLAKAKAYEARKREEERK